MVDYAVMHRCFEKEFIFYDGENVCEIVGAGNDEYIFHSAVPHAVQKKIELSCEDKLIFEEWLEV